MRFAYDQPKNRVLDILGRWICSPLVDADTEGKVQEAVFFACADLLNLEVDLPQVIIGLAVTREGIPVRVWVWPANTNNGDRRAVRGDPLGCCPPATNINGLVSRGCWRDPKAVEDDTDSDADPLVNSGGRPSGGALLPASPRST